MMDEWRIVKQWHFATAHDYDRFYLYIVALCDRGSYLRIDLNTTHIYQCMVDAGAVRTVQMICNPRRKHVDEMTAQEYKIFAHNDNYPFRQTVEEISAERFPATLSVLVLGDVAVVTAGYAHYLDHVEQKAALKEGE